MAMASILQNHSPQEVPFAVDITATTAFPWHRWLRNVVANREIIGSGIVKVFALCLTSIQEAQIVFCHPDDTYTLAKPGKILEYRQFTGWRDRQILAEAPVQTVSWLGFEPNGYETYSHQPVTITRPVFCHLRESYRSLQCSSRHTARVAKYVHISVVCERKNDRERETDIYIYIYI